MQDDHLRLWVSYSAKGDDYQPRTRHFDDSGRPKFVNELILEKSPYLLQHAHNPVAWHAWSEETFALAKATQRPIFLSIGYSTCHWCHVMEHESFEDLEVAAILNEHFISVKVDREQRPDVDNVYMTAVMLITRHGGWPMSTFLTPDGRPFYGGTYYPKQQFTTLLTRIAELWRTEREQLLTQAQQISSAVKRHQEATESAASTAAPDHDRAVTLLMEGFDELQGGFGSAPKFPHESTLQYLSDYALREQHADVSNAVLFSLDAMADGGIFDQVGGGFHRYATDDGWLIPHFEKMLYNQAQLVQAYLDGFLFTGKERYRVVIERTLDYLLNEMQSLKGAFFAASDADSEGEEGRFFVWTPQQIRAAVKDQELEFALQAYAISELGNFEGSNILHRGAHTQKLVDQMALDAAELEKRLAAINTQLYATRLKRVAPHVDTKVISSWNGMTIAALARAARILELPRFAKAAEGAARHLWKEAWSSQKGLFRVAGDSSVPAVVDDYAQLADGLLELYLLDQEPQWLSQAQQVVERMDALFWDSGNGGYFMSGARADVTLFSRPKEAADGALFAGNAVALRVLAKLYFATGEIEYQTKAHELVQAFAGEIVGRPSAHAGILLAHRMLTENTLSDTVWAAGGHAHLRARRLNSSSASVEITLADQWHINSNRPGVDGFVATRINVAHRDRAEVTTTYPVGVNRQVGFSDDELNLYHGTAVLKLAISEQEEAGPLMLTVSLQACNERYCLAPEEVTLLIPA